MQIEIIKNIKKQTKGITLVALIVTIIVLLILAGVAISLSLGNNGIFQKAVRAKEQTEIASEKEKIQLAYSSVNMSTNSSSENDFFEQIKTELDWKKAEYTITGSSSMIIKSENGNEYTVTKEGTIFDGKVAYLDIADGNIDLYSKGYKQYIGSLQNPSSNNATTYTGDYIITGKTTENVVRVCDVGTYNITIKDLNIDVSAKYRLCAFNGNRGNKETDCFVNITIEGENYFHGSNDAAGLGFSKAIPNINGTTNGSTLTLNGNGKLEVIGGDFRSRRRKWIYWKGSCRRQSK